MNFTRSPSSLYSIHVFFGVDVVVYCEGGSPLSYGDALSMNRENGTLDTFYWSSVLSVYNIDKKYHFKSVGGKETINAIANDISRLGLTNLTVCRDSDYDRALGKTNIGGRVAWTMGYSWENDVVSLPILERLVSNLIGSGIEGVSAIDSLRDKFKFFQRDLPKWVEIDVSFCHRGRGGLFDRAKPLAAIDMDSPPCLRQGDLQQKLLAAGYQRKPRKIVSVKSSDVLSVCYGKLIGKAAYHAFKHVINPFLNIRLSYELFMRLAITETINAIKIGLLPNYKQHLLNQQTAF